jgi:hypothetical protein
MPSGNRVSASSDRQHQTDAAANDTADKKWSAPIASDANDPTAGIGGELLS